MSNIIQFRKAKGRKYIWEGKPLPESTAYYRVKPDSCGIEYDFVGAYPKDFWLGEENIAAVDGLQVDLPNFATGICIAMEYAGRPDHAQQLMELMQSLIDRKAVGTYLCHVPNHLKGYLVRLVKLDYHNDPFERYQHYSPDAREFYMTISAKEGLLLSERYYEPEED